MTAVEEVLPGVTDWSTIDQPSSDTFGSNTDKSEWGKYKLSSADVARFWKNGFLSNIPVLTAEQCELLLEDYKYFTNPPGERHPGHDLLYEFHSNESGEEDNTLMHCLGHWRVTKLFHDLIFHPQIVTICSQLLVEGETKPVRFWHDQLFAKPPHHGGVVAWHQDYSYWDRTKPCMHVTVHIALEDQTEENGTLKYIPGSHRWRGGATLPGVSFGDMDAIKESLTEEEKSAFKPVSSLLKKGEASFHHSLVVHGSYGNKSDVPRRAAVLNYFADGVYSDTDGPMLVLGKDGKSSSTLFSGSSIPKGQKMQGQFYPMVFDPQWLEK